MFGASLLRASCSEPTFGASSPPQPQGIPTGDAAGGPVEGVAGAVGADSCLASAAVMPWTVGMAAWEQGYDGGAVGAMGVAEESPAQDLDMQGVEPWSHCCSGARGAVPADSGGEYLQLLRGEWQSLVLGYIRVGDASEGDCRGSGLLVSKAGDDGEILGRVSLSQDPETTKPRVKLELESPGGGDNFDFHINPAGKGCSAHRITWMDSSHANSENAKEADIWNKSLLDEIRKAAEWIEKPERSLLSDVEAGLALLASDELTVSNLSVGLCTATKNRLWQLRRALPLNLLHAWRHRNWVKIHLVDCDSNDGTLKWVFKNCRAAIDAGLLTVYSTEGRMPFWHASVAKNTAHMVSREDILVNVDGDNLIGRDFVCNVVEYFKAGSTVLQYGDGDGTCGRIACWKREFHDIRGYDEDAYPMGAQDVDLVLRLKELHPYKCYQKVHVSSFNSQAIHNDVPAKVACCDPRHGPGGLKWGRMDTLNRSIFQQRRQAGQLVRNLHLEKIGLQARVKDPQEVLGAVT